MDSKDINRLDLYALVYSSRFPDGISLADRFWAKVNKAASDECWEWTGAKQSFGYGSIIRNDRRTEKAHRISYVMNVGSIPDGLWVLHKCDNPSCVNPNHLYLGDHKDNMRDKRVRGRVRTTPVLGEDKPNAVLTEDEVRAIRREFKQRRPRYADLAKKYGVFKTTIGRIIRRETWKHVD